MIEFGSGCMLDQRMCVGMCWGGGGGGGGGQLFTHTHQVTRNTTCTRSFDNSEPLSTRVHSSGYHNSVLATQPQELAICLSDQSHGEPLYIIRYSCKPYYIQACNAA